MHTVRRCTRRGSQDTSGNVWMFEFNMSPVLKAVGKGEGVLELYIAHYESILGNTAL